MKALSQRAGIWFAAGSLLFAVGLPAQGDEFAVNTPETAKRIDFKVDLQPQDPFTNANKVGAPREFSRGEVIRLVIQGTPRPGFHTYPLTKQLEGQKFNVSTLKYGKNADLQTLWPPTETPAPAPLKEIDGEVYLEHRNQFTWTQNLYIKPNTKPGLEHLQFSIHVQVCNEGTCLDGSHDFDMPFTIIDAPVVAAPPDLEQRLLYTPPPAEKLNFKGKDYSVVSVLPPVKPDGAVAPPVAPPPAVGPSASGLWDLLSFIGMGIASGALSLLTPCVFPMIPITVSFFLKQSAKSSVPALAGVGGSGIMSAPAPMPSLRKGHSPIVLAAVYSATIALVLAAAGLLLIPVIQSVSRYWATNLVLGGLFTFFALSLFGMYDIVLPSGLGRLTSAGEGRGGLVGVIFMALTFTIISFACVGPFYGTLIALSVTTSVGGWVKSILGAVAFSVTFALPFFVLALFPALLKKMPKSGSWLNTVKVVMGFLELAAAIKLFRTAEINFSVTTRFLTFDLALGIYIALALACGLYLLRVFRLPHDHGTPETLSVPRLMFSLACLGLGLYLLPGLFPFKTEDGDPEKPKGALFAWVDAFLLREETPPKPSLKGAPGTDRLVWTADLKEALKRAEAEKKLVFLDFTGQTCTNCKYNEGNVFTDPNIKELLRQYLLVRLYTDNVPPGYVSSTTGEQNETFLFNQFKTRQLPLYAVLKPKEGGGYEVVGRPYPEGMINNVPGFAKFLQDPLLTPTAEARADAGGE
jgi:thiol:disulfide interchange protein